MAVDGTGPGAGLATALDAARAAVEEAGLQGLCREGREAIAVDVLRTHGVADAERRAVRLVTELESAERP